MDKVCRARSMGKYWHYSGKRDADSRLWCHATAASYICFQHKNGVVELKKKSRFESNSIARILDRFVLGCIACSVYGCSLDGLVKVSDPEEGRSVNIKEVTTRSGALSVYASALGKFQTGVSEISKNVSLFTDEREIHPGANILADKFDARIIGVDGLQDKESYEYLNSARITFSQVRDIVRKLNDPSISYLLSASYALEGYSVLMLAENFCSGIPLSRLSFDGTVNYEQGSSTSQTLKTAISLFDSSMAIEHDSTRFNILPRIGKGRAYLSLGQLDSAYASVENVDVNSAFNLYYTEALDLSNKRPYTFWRIKAMEYSISVLAYGVKNNEGVNGIQWFSLTQPIDSRIPMNIELINGVYLGRPHKYTGSTLVFPLAKGIEKKMIESEYLLSVGDSRWIDVINEARQTKGIPDTVDPGTPKAREDLLFRERALWFYFDGYRLADYRRLVRQYARSPYEVYPVGVYEGGNGTTPIYGDAFVFSPPERPNRKYLGCDHKNP